MKKIFTLILVTFASLSFANANNDPNKGGDENKTSTILSFKNRSNPSQSKWFASIGAGAQIYFGDHDKQMKSVGERITPKFEVTAGTWFHHLFGVRLNVNLAKMKGLTQNNDLRTPGTPLYDYGHPTMTLMEQEFTYMNIHADLMFDWLNDATGVNPDRIYSLIPYVGVGLVTAVDKQKGTSVAANLGLLQSFKVSNKFNVNLDIKGNVFADKVDAELGGRNFEGQLSAVVGLQYSF